METGAFSEPVRSTTARALASWEALTDWPAKDLRAEVARHYGPYWQGMPTEAHVVFARLLHGIGNDEVRIDLLLDKDRDATRICFALADRV